MFVLAGPLKFRNSKILFLAIISASLTFDTMLNTITVPIMPRYLYDIDHPDEGILQMSTNTVSLTKYYNTTMTSVDAQSNKTSVSKEEQHDYYVKETIPAGLLFATKCVMQLIANPFVGILADRIGYSAIMFAGFVILFFSTIIFAFAGTYTILYIARSLQGIGSSCAAVASLGMLADLYPDEKERSTALGIALSGLGMGAIFGPTFGGFMYDFVGKSAPFLTLSAAILFVAVIRTLVSLPKNDKKQMKKPSFTALITDPYILLATGALIVSASGLALIQSVVPIWMMDTMEVSTWQQGAAFLPISISYFISTNLFGIIGRHITSFRWLSTLISLIIQGIALLWIPFCSRVYQLMTPLAGVGISMAIAECSMMAELAHLVDIRYTSIYGTIFAIADTAFCSSYALGGLFGGIIMNQIGFQWLMISVGVTNILLAPLMIMLRNPPSKENSQESSSSEGTYNASSEHI